MMIFQKFHRRAPGKQAFTLVELLVALAVLSILVLILAQVVSLTGQAIDINSRKLTAAAQARSFFDRFAADFAARPQRPDLSMVFTQDYNNTKNAGIQFWSGTGGYGANTPRQLSWISYGIGSPKTTTANKTSPAPDCLIRGADAGDWTGAGTPISFAPLSALPTTPVPAPDNADVLASGIFRMDFCYLLKDGSLSTTPSAPTTPPRSANDFSQVAAIVIAVAALDAKSLRLLSNEQVTNLSNDLPATPPALHTADPLAYWSSDTVMGAQGFGPGIPRQVIENVRLYQRIFYVP